MFHVVRTTPKEFWFVFEENSVREITGLLWLQRFQKAPFSKRFSFRDYTKTKSWGFQIPSFQIEECRLKASFSWRISVDTIGR